jgi:putative heme utilization carrier protein HutX
MLTEEAHEEDRTEAIRSALASKPGAALEDIAQAAGCSFAEVLRALPPEEAIGIDGSHFVEVMQAISQWGEITLVVNSGDVILEVKGELPAGSLGHGYYNLHGKPIGGHLRADACATIAFVSRKLFGSDTHSVQFIAPAGHCLFKIYLGRDAARCLIPEQVLAFTGLRARLAGA